MNNEVTHQKAIYGPAILGIRKAAQTTLLLTKIIIPVTFVLVLLDKAGILAELATYLAPFLKVFGLPGEAALPLFLGFFINIYAAMGAMAVLSLSGQQITVIAAMILTCHSLLMETPVLKLSGVHPVVAILARISGAILLGLLLQLLYQIPGVFR